MRMAVHFDASWRPNGWTSRGDSWVPALGITVLLLVVFTGCAYVVRTSAKPALTAWVLLIVFYLTIGFVSYLSNWVIEYNLRPLPQHAFVVVRSEVSS